MCLSLWVSITIIKLTIMHTSTHHSLPSLSLALEESPGLQSGIGDRDEKREYVLSGPKKVSKLIAF